MSDQTTWKGKRGWEARWYLWDGGFMAIGPVPDNDIVPAHAHHAIQVAVGLDGFVGLHEPGTEWTRSRAMMVAPNVPHEFDPMRALLTMLFVDPETREGRWMLRSFSAAIVSVPDDVVEEWVPQLKALWERPLDGSGTARLIHAFIRALCVGPPPPYRLDPRVVRALEVIRGMDTAKLSLEDVARAVFLSPSRFAHLFSSEVGIPFRRYLLWRRYTRALVAVGEGHTLSSAAHMAGFADSAHLTRTSVQMFGLPPSIVIQPGEFYQIPAPFELPFLAA